MNYIIACIGNNWSFSALITLLVIAARPVQKPKLHGGLGIDLTVTIVENIAAAVESSQPLGNPKKKKGESASQDFKGHT